MTAVKTNSNQCRHKAKKTSTTQMHTWIYQINGSIFLSQGIGTVKWRGIGGVRWEKGGAKYDPIVGGCNPTNMTWWGIALIGAL